VLILCGPVGESGHVGPSLHPERPGRVGAVMAGVEDLRLGSECISLAAPEASIEDLVRVHAADYLSELEAFANRGGGQLDPDTYVVADSWVTARKAAGAGIAVVDELRERGDGIGLVVTRPPGHHAERERGMGFCLLNNVAVSAASLRAAGHRVLIIDWDVHHGNGTQAIFWEDPDVFYVSTHEWPLFPGTGNVFEIGGSSGIGTTLNVPLPAGATGDVVRAALEDVAGPAVERFAPDWVLVSCGFDAHRDDPLAGLELSSGDFARLARIASEFTPAPGRLVLFLEGGYDLSALRLSTAATVSALLGGMVEPESETFGGPGLTQVGAMRTLHERAIRRAQGIGA
jgi:acetoin utilization deacetylase AcuC-like enzyme